MEQGTSRGAGSDRAAARRRMVFALCGAVALVAGCGEAPSRATAFTDEAGHRCQVDCSGGTDACALACEQPPSVACSVGVVPGWVVADVAWPDASGTGLLVLCPACDGLYAAATCSPVTCEAPEDCPFAKHDCVNSRCERMR